VNGNEAARRALLAELESAPLPSVQAFGAAAPSLDVEWFFSARELCALMESVHELPFMAINPGLANKNEWARIAFKGGSEPGVANLTTRLERDGKKHCVVATWNDRVELDQPKLYALYRALLDTL
jgi:hypothetical protein